MAIISRTEDLEIFLATIDSGSLSAAARALDIQVARVSRALSRLESELDCTLLNRTTRKLELTEEGRLFSDRVRQGLRCLSQAEDTLKELKEQPSGRLRVDAVTPFMIHQLVPLLPEFQQAYPHIELELVSNESIIDLIERRTDVAVRIGPLKDSNLHARFLGRSPLSIVASRQYLERYGSPNNINELTNHRIIGFTQSTHLNSWPIGKGVDIKPNISSSNGELIRQMCLQGEGLALLSHFMIKKDLKTKKLVEILPGSVSKQNQRELVNAVFYRNTALSSRIRAFLDFIEPRLTLA
ncbi:LysR family transcriptional regulator [Microbulbifer sp. CNSA002]|uniref:LysR family transcriptional regulator n=2 Tax=unclassified Microbulbifer TaxID=2619833 RepID=UPI0039B5C1A6